MRFLKFSLLFFVLWVLIFSNGCRKRILDTSPNAILEFSEDTLTFDTVFTTIGSATLSFKVYNRNRNKVNISAVTLAGGATSNFRINVDGLPGDAGDIEIYGNDSIYVFVEVTVDMNNQNNPLVILDSVVFNTNGNHQRVILEAWGQDAHFYSRANLPTDYYIVGNDTFLRRILPCDDIWLNDKPHVILTNVFVKENCALTFNPGVEIYMGGNASLFVSEGASLNIQGYVDQPVTFQGIRLESFFDDLPGQWRGIFLLRGSQSNIDYAIIKNADYGISAGDALISSGCDFGAIFNGNNIPTLNLKNTIIQNCLVNGISGTLANIDAENCLVFNCGDRIASFQLGGFYNFTHCTFANYGSNTVNHQSPNIFLGTGLEVTCNNSTQIYEADLQATFTNVINYGSLDEEIESQEDYGRAVMLNYTFDHCLVKTEIVDSIGAFISPVLNKDPLFTDRMEDDYTLSEFSPCRDSGKATSVFIDLAGRSRDGTPDIGAYEYFME